MTTNDKGFVTKGTAEYFAERERKVNERINDAKAKIDEIEQKVRGEINEITTIRNRIQTHLDGFLQARNDLAQHREKTVALIDSLNSVVSICDGELPELDRMLDGLESDYKAEDGRLSDAEKSRRRQLHKHERAKARYELRSARLGLRKRLILGAAQSESP